MTRSLAPVLVAGVLMSGCAAIDLDGQISHDEARLVSIVGVTLANGASYALSRPDGSLDDDALRGIGLNLLTRYAVRQLVALGSYETARDVIAAAAPVERVDVLEVPEDGPLPLPTWSGAIDGAIPEGDADG